MMLSCTTCIAYVYTDQTFVYPEEEAIEPTSYLSPLELNGKKVIFTVDKELKPAIFYDKTLISSLPQIIKKMTAISIPKFYENLMKKDQEGVLKKIATIANYLSDGTSYQIDPNSGQIKRSKKENSQLKLTFSATDRDDHHYKVILDEQAQVYYKLNYEVEVKA